jgi:hypothetical protein
MVIGQCIFIQQFLIIEHWNKTPDDYRHCNIFLTYEAFNEDPDK